ncbi:MAG: SMP-30/gluconolactonase/LRE family protein [Nitrososphaerota archaeon]|jgi:sugar lactone lactonase YvrE|nr:SMP-30/gluconolactonase/LRE family protein [Nitrososphaerota archaeon]MDG6947258.1 SMP-30/gluconolactonase/LRE family protein [Nitrososphaerota archaeon]MDG6955309.1 SMP-30/gluconolactonase/LRE family protein [Nitrososphaerota archaeon]
MGNSIPVELAYDSKAQVGEGPSWDERRGVLHWVDIISGLVNTYHPSTSENKSRRVGRFVSSVVPSKSGRVVMTLQHEVCALDLESGKVKVLAVAEAGEEENRFNDGKCDPAGRLWAGTMSLKGKKGNGALYVLERGRKIRKVLGGVSTSNGLGWSPDGGTMYYIDTPTRKVSAFDCEINTWEIKNRRTVVDFGGQPGNPDGMAVDEEGKLWVAHWGGWRVTRWNPETGENLSQVDLPVPLVSSCCFGGEKLDRLYITTARTGLDAEQLSEVPNSGGLFVAQVGARGLPTYAFDE